MAAVFTNLTAGRDNTNSSATYATASVTWNAGDVVLVASKTRATGLPGTSTITATGLSFSLIGEITYQTVAAPLERMSIHGAIAAAGGSSAVTIDPPISVTHCKWVVDKVSGLDTSGGTVASLLQQAAATNRTDNATSLTVTLGSAITSGNAVYAAFGSSNVTEAQTADADYTELAESGVVGDGTASDSGMVQTMYCLAPPDTTVQASSASSTAERGGVAVELKVATGGGGGPIQPPRTMHQARLRRAA